MIMMPGRARGIGLVVCWNAMCGSCAPLGLDVFAFWSTGLRQALRFLPLHPWLQAGAPSGRAESGGARAESYSTGVGVVLRRGVVGG